MISAWGKTKNNSFLLAWELNMNVDEVSDNHKKERFPFVDIKNGKTLVLALHIELESWIH